MNKEIHMILQKFINLFIVAMMFLVVGCSTTYKQRQEERNKVAQASGLYCEFVNGDANLDADVELNLQMSKKCDLSKQFTVTNYKNASDIFGLVYCCHYQKNKAPAAATGTSKSATPSSTSTGDGLE